MSPLLEKVLCQNIMIKVLQNYHMICRKFASYYRGTLQPIIREVLEFRKRCFSSEIRFEGSINSLLVVKTHFNIGQSLQDKHIQFTLSQIDRQNKITFELEVSDERALSGFVCCCDEGKGLKGRLRLAPNMATRVNL